MTKKELIDKYVHWAMIYVDMNGELPLKEITKEAEVQITHLVVMMNKGCKARAARVLKEGRTTTSERLRLKGQWAEEELKEIAEKHSVTYVPYVKEPIK